LLFSILKFIFSHRLTLAITYFKFPYSSWSWPIQYFLKILIYNHMLPEDPLHWIS
jgi:hypothetical protein